VTVREALRSARQKLERLHVPSAQLTSEILLCHVLGCERVWLFAHPEETLSEEQEQAYAACIRRRAAGEPTQYITGVQEFYGRPFRVTPDVLIPRPETEFVVEAALGAGKAETIVDVGCGSGAIGVTLALETGARVIATDVSRAALRVAVDNARRLRARVEFVACDLLSAIASGVADMVVSNPPYVPDADLAGLPREVREHEPGVALHGGAEGLDFYRRLIEEAPRVLRPGGRLILELGIRQMGAVEEMARRRWKTVKKLNDLAGLPRVLVLRLR